MFNKDGSHKKGKWRLYCEHEGCKKYIMMEWGGGYGCAKDKDGNQCDMRNQCWYCKEHI